VISRNGKNSIPSVLDLRILFLLKLAPHSDINQKNIHMKNSPFVVKALVLTVLFSLAVSAAQAQSRTWVSGVGNDANPCSRTAPCKTFAGAIAKTATGGEINVLDPGGFGALTITKAITVDGLGFIGGNLASGISGFTINITTNLASDKVILRNLEINGNSAAGGFHGIRFLDGAELTVENVQIFGFTGSGINVAQTQTSTTNIRNVSVDNVSLAGVSVTTTGGVAVVTIDNCRLRGTTEGVLVINNGRVAVRDTVITGATKGVRTTGSNSIVQVDDNWIGFCITGIEASAGSIISVSDSIMAMNTTGVNANGGAINSLQGNSLPDNTVPGVFSATALKQ
jgi:hypothetical protein